MFELNSLPYMLLYNRAMRILTSKGVRNILAYMEGTMFPILNHVSSLYHHLPFADTIVHSLKEHHSLIHIREAQYS